MKFLHYLVIFFVLVIFSCKKDKGNYDYKVLPDFAILRDSLPKDYQVRQGNEILTIDPVLIASDTTDYEYLWRVYQTNLQFPAFFKYDTIGTARVLKTLINAEPGTTNTIELRLTQKSTKLFKFYTFGVSTLTDVPQGWMVAYEKNGESDIDIVRYAQLTGSTKDTVYRQQLKAGLLGSTFSGKIFNLVSGTSAGTGVWLNSDKGVIHLEGNSFNLLSDFNQIFLGSPPVVLTTQTPGLFRNGNTMFYVNDGVIHWSFQESFVGLGAFSNGQSYRAAPWITAGLGTIALFYDEIGKRFVNMQVNNSTIFAFPTLSGTQKFALNNIGKELVWMEGGFQSNKYAIFKDATGPARYLYVVGSATTDAAKALVPNLGNLPEIQQAKFFNASLAEANVFYATNKTLYGFYVSLIGDNYGSLIKSFEAPTGEEITCVNLLKTGTTSGRRICIATWNETTKVGKMYVYDVTPVSGQFSLAPLFVTTHDGKITAMEHKRN